MDGDLDLFQGIHQRLQTIGEQDGGGGVSEQEGARDEHHDAHHHEEGIEYALQGDGQHPDFHQNRFAGGVEQVQNGGEGGNAANTMKAQLRDLRDTVNNPIFLRSLQETEPDRLIGETIYFDRNGNFDTSDYLMIAGDWSKAVYAIREDIEYRLLTEATIIDPTTKNVVYALAQQDMAAMRFKMRLGVQVANPATRANSSSSTRYPFSVLTPAST